MQFVAFFSSQLQTHYANKLYADISFVKYTNKDADERVASRDGLDGSEILVGAIFLTFPDRTSVPPSLL